MSLGIEGGADDAAVTWTGVTCVALAVAGGGAAEDACGVEATAGCAETAAPGVAAMGATGSGSATLDAAGATAGAVPESTAIAGVAANACTGARGCR